MLIILYILKRLYSHNSSGTTTSDKIDESIAEIRCVSRGRGDAVPVVDSQLPQNPYQPSSDVIPTQNLLGKKLKFQPSWFNKYTWLHYDDALLMSICKVCCVTFVPLLKSSRWFTLREVLKKRLFQKAIETGKKRFKSFPPMH